MAQLVRWEEGGIFREIDEVGKVKGAHLMENFRTQIEEFLLNLKN